MQFSITQFLSFLVCDIVIFVLCAACGSNGIAYGNVSEQNCDNKHNAKNNNNTEKLSLAVSSHRRDVN